MKLNRENFLIQVKYADFLSGNINIPEYFLGFGGELYLALEELANYDPGVISLVKKFVTSHYLPLRFHAPITEIDYSKIRDSIERIKPVYFQMAELCKVLNINSVTTHADFNYKNGVSPGEQLGNAVILWRELSGTLEKYGIGLNIENHFEKEPDYLLRLMDAIKSAYFAMCVDVGHLNAFGKSDMKCWLEKYPVGSIREVHLADNKGDDDTHLPLGKGNVDFYDFFEILSRRDERPVFILEPRNIEEAKESLIFLRKKGYLECARA